MCDFYTKPVSIEVHVSRNPKSTVKNSLTQIYTLLHQVSDKHKTTNNIADTTANMNQQYGSSKR